jgi:hypothetical protein
MARNRKVRRVRSGATPAAEENGPPRTQEEELREEYAYVLRDLRRVFILAAVMFLLLIALNLVL